MVFGEMMMGDKAAKAVPSLAVVEKRQAPRPMGGCVGIFFQLFDWHRRFTKKKLFSRKLLPPGTVSLTLVFLIIVHHYRNLRYPSTRSFTGYAPNRNIYLPRYNVFVLSVLQNNFRPLVNSSSQFKCNSTSETSNEELQAR